MDNLSIIHKLDIKNAPLPVSYELAKIAISECNNIDECKGWNNKAKALASYARQAGDDELEQMSKRIRARAMRRCGELLKLFDGRPNNNPSGKAGTQNDLEVNLGTKKMIGNNAGLTDKQITTANRLANIPEDKFNKLVESDQVPTLTALSEQGRQAREYLSKPKPEGFADAIHFIGFLREVHEYTQKHSHEYILNGMDEKQKSETLNIIQELELWFDKFVVNV